MFVEGGLQRGDKVLVDGDWYPVCGYSLTCHPDGSRTGAVFTLKPRGQFEPCLGYRINYADITGHRRSA